MKLRVACSVGVVDFRKQQVALGLSADQTQILIPPRQNPVSKKQQFRADCLRTDLFSPQLQNYYVPRQGS